MRIPVKRFMKVRKGESPGRQLRGLGDAVEVLAKPIARAIGLEDCKGCEKRKKWLNEKVPFKDA